VVFYVGNRTIIPDIKRVLTELRAEHGHISDKHTNASQPISDRFMSIPSAQELLTHTLQKRYNTQDHTLDLSSFDQEPTLRENDMTLKLYRPDHFALLVRIMKTVPLAALKGLNLSSNNLRNMQQLVPLLEHAPNVEKLILKSNHRISEWTDLKWIQPWKLKELDIQECSLNNKKQKRMAQTRDARKTFKHLTILNGKAFHSITFDIQTEAEAKKVPTLPESKSSVFPSDPSINTSLLDFIQKYISAYDSNREELFPIYAPEAKFSISVGWGHGLDAYRRHQRNLINFRYMKEGGDKYRTPHLNTIKNKKISIIALMTELPKTQHDLINTKLDCSLEIPQVMVAFTLTGVFKEVGETTETFRYFSRHMICQISGSQFLIRNDQLFIRQATKDESSKFGSSPPPQPAAAAPAVPNEQNMAESVKRFSVQSGLTEAYSKMCLEQNQWNYNLSAERFMEAKNANKLPQEAWLPGRAP
jgi:nuclear RNA export factor